MAGMTPDRRTASFKGTLPRAAGFSRRLFYLQCFVKKDFCYD